MAHFKMNKKGVVPLFIWIILAAIVVIPILLGGAGVTAFLLTDKTPLIIGGLFLFIILLGQKKRRQ